jgi:hypothetical protein
MLDLCINVIVKQHIVCIIVNNYVGCCPKISKSRVAMPGCSKPIINNRLPIIINLSLVEFNDGKTV